MKTTQHETTGRIQSARAAGWMIAVAALVWPSGQAPAADPVLAAGSNEASQLSIDQQPVFSTVPISDMGAIAAGQEHTLVLKSDHTVWAWGGNVDGQLGDGTTETRQAPVQVTDLTDVVSILAGPGFSLAAKYDGTVWAWGRNDNGQLGTGARDDNPHPTPAQVPGLTDVKVVVGGPFFDIGYAIRNDNTLWSWGGKSGLTTYYTPRQINANVADVSNTWLDSMVRKTDGAVTVNAVAMTTDAAAISGGARHFLVAKTNGTVWAWGENESGQLGDGSTTKRTSPVQVQDLENVAEVAAGGYHSLAIKNNGTVWIWGTPLPPPLGAETRTRVLTPVQVPGVSNAVDVLAGEYWSLILLADGSVLQWAGAVSTPVNVPAVTDAVRVTAGEFHSLALNLDGGVTAWGANWDYQLGDPTVLSSLGVQVPGLVDAVAVAAGGAHSLAVGRDGSVWAWGLNGYGQLGDGTITDTNTPVAALGIGPVVAVAAGGDHSMALTADGSVWAWGCNEYRQLGDGSTESRSTVVRVQNLHSVVGIAAGRSHSLAVRCDGSVWAWGANNAGQLGDGNEGFNASSSVPVAVTGLSDVKLIAAGDYHSLAVKADGTAWAWGDNGVGQLGDGTWGEDNRSPLPVQVSGLSGVIAVSGGRRHSLAATSDGTAWAWGYNADGRLGSGTTLNSPVPVAVEGVTGAVRVAGGGSHTLIGTNDTPPAVLATWPGDEQSAAGAVFATVSFTEPVTNVTTDDLAVLVGEAVSSAGGGAGPYFFRLANTQRGPNAMLIDGDITDSAGGGLSPSLWTFDLTTVVSDLDADTDVDGFDFLTFSNCYNGSDRAILSACANPGSDIDADGDVDGFDFLTFANCYNGSDRSPLCP